MVQQSDNDIQQIETIVCQKDEKTTCRTEEFDDSPKDSTTCKQIFSIRKLLAIDENGVVSVDSFQLPSACLCRYVLVRIHQYTVKMDFFPKEVVESKSAATPLNSLNPNKAQLDL